MKYKEKHKIQRKNYFLWADAHNSELSSTGKNNVWNYNRAPDGLKFELVGARLTVGEGAGYRDGIVTIFDGHVYNTRWDIYPGVIDHQILTRSVTNLYSLDLHMDLYGWECKEYTIGTRSVSTEQGVRYHMVVWYYLVPMSRLEKFMYAVLHPKRKYRKGGMSTLDPFE